MKKTFLVVFALVLLFLLSVFFFIPDKLTVSKVVFIKANQNSVFRVLSDKRKWIAWWPSEKPVHSINDLTKNYRFYYNSFLYQPDKIFYNKIQVIIENNKTENSSFINLIPVHIDSVAIEWKCELKTGLNPVKKIMQYKKAGDIKNNMNRILDSLRSFLDKGENIYGFNIERTTLIDTVLVATKTITKNYPTTATVYSLVNNLKEYIVKQGAKEVNYPMLNVTKKDSSTYETMVGIPTNKRLAESGAIFYRRLSPIPNKILTTEVKGGPSTIHQAFNAIANYMTDHQLAAPVIPFEYLVTDRSKESDTTKWVTKIYYPII